MNKVYLPEENKRKNTFLKKMGKYAPVGRHVEIPECKDGTIDLTKEQPEQNKDKRLKTQKFETVIELDHDTDSDIILVNSEEEKSLESILDVGEVLQEELTDLSKNKFQVSVAENSSESRNIKSSKKKRKMEKLNMEKNILMIPGHSRNTKKDKKYEHKKRPTLDDKINKSKKQERNRRKKLKRKLKKMKNT